MRIFCSMARLGTNRRYGRQIRRSSGYFLPAAAVFCHSATLLPHTRSAIITSWDVNVVANPRPTFSRQTVSPPRSRPPAEKPMAESAPQRHVLPKNLLHAVKQLSDGGLDEHFEVACDEARRRGRLPPSVEADSTARYAIKRLGWPAVPPMPICLLG